MNEQPATASVAVPLQMVTSFSQANGRGEKVGRFQLLESNLSNKTSFDRQWLVKLLRKHNSPEKNSLLWDRYPILIDKALVVAPMVEQSDLPFRLQCRKYGANLAYTPMIHSRYFCTKHSYRHKMWTWTDDGTTAKDALQEDRPLIAQLCGNNKEVLLQAATQLEQHVDAIDLNCGCPTQKAKRGGYGAFLLQSGSHLVEIIKYLAERLTCPLTVKVRLLPGGNIEESIALYEQLVDAGASMLTIHGRTRFQKGANTQKADWEAIRKVVDRLGDRIPIIANGSIGSLKDARDCIAVTGVDGIMSSEALLEYPPLFSSLESISSTSLHHVRLGPGRIQLAREYLDLCRAFPPEKGGGGTGIQCIRMHLETFLYNDLKKDIALQNTLFCAERLVQLYALVDQIDTLHKRMGHKTEEEQLSWYTRHRDNQGHTTNET